MQTSTQTRCRDMTDTEYVNRVLDPVFRPLIEDLSKRMPERPVDYIKAWVAYPPPLHVTLQERRRYFDQILGPIVQSIAEECLNHRPANVLLWLQDLMARVPGTNERQFDDKNIPGAKINSAVELLAGIVGRGSAPRANPLFNVQGLPNFLDGSSNNFVGSNGKKATEPASAAAATPADGANFSTTTGNNTMISVDDHHRVLKSHMDVSAQQMQTMLSQMQALQEQIHVLAAQNSSSFAHYADRNQTIDSAHSAHTRQKSSAKKSQPSQYNIATSDGDMSNIMSATDSKTGLDEFFSKRPPKEGLHGSAVANNRVNIHDAVQQALQTTQNSSKNHQNTTEARLEAQMQRRQQMSGGNTSTASSIVGDPNLSGLIGDTSGNNLLNNTIF